MKTLENKVIELRKLVDTINERLGLDGLDYLCENKIKGLSNFDSFFECLLDNNYTTVDIIYYSHAIDYLVENDNSLKESINIALEYDLSLENINSELLASLHATRKLEELLHEYRDEINEILGDCE